MNYFSSKSSNCFFSFFNSLGDILYGVIGIGPVPDIKSIENSISLLGDKLGISLGKTSRKFGQLLNFSKQLPPYLYRR